MMAIVVCMKRTEMQGVGTDIRRRIDDSWFVVHGGGAAAGGGETLRALREALRRSLSHRREASGKRQKIDERFFKTGLFQNDLSYR